MQASQQLQDVPLVDQMDEDDVELSDEDMDFVQQYGNRLGFLNKLDKKELDK